MEFCVNHFMDDKEVCIATFFLLCILEVAIEHTHTNILSARVGTVGFM